MSLKFDLFPTCKYGNLMEHIMELEVTALQGTSTAVSQQNEKTAEHLTLSGKHRSAMNWLASFTHDSRAWKHGRWGNKNTAVCVYQTIFVA